MPATYHRGDGVVFECVVVRIASPTRTLIRYTDGLRRVLAFVHPSLIT